MFATRETWRPSSDSRDLPGGRQLGGAWTFWSARKRKSGAAFGCASISEPPAGVVVALYRRVAPPTLPARRPPEVVRARRRVSAARTASCRPVLVLLGAEEVGDVRREAAVRGQVVRRLVAEVAFADEVARVADRRQLLGDRRRCERQKIGAGVVAIRLHRRDRERRAAAEERAAGRRAEPEGVVPLKEQAGGAEVGDRRCGSVGVADQVSCQPRSSARMVTRCGRGAKATPALRLSICSAAASAAAWADGTCEV